MTLRSTPRRLKVQKGPGTESEAPGTRLSKTIALVDPVLKVEWEVAACD
jgi:hypothetical protein